MLICSELIYAGCFNFSGVRSVMRSGGLQLILKIHNMRFSILYWEALSPDKEDMNFCLFAFLLSQYNEVGHTQGSHLSLKHSLFVMLPLELHRDVILPTYIYIYIYMYIIEEASC